ncbi:MAG TPA: serine/threonine-protein kinase [Caulifigura sp.]|nr:serine/threonine-protein kinase [Caulifigura sp.]
MIVAIDLFLETLRRSRLLPEETVAAEVARFHAAKGGRKDAKAFAETLCRRRLLTVWQAQNLLAGKHKGYFVGGYTLQGMLGKGGMSFVYLAEHRILKRRCAIKVLPAAKALSPALLSRFHREARAAATLDHPNVVRMLDAGAIPDGSSSVHYLVMEHIDGCTLFDVVRHSGPLTVAKAVDAIRQAARGLQHVHDAGLVHRDIKPENLIVDRRGVVRLMDLGLAKFIETDEEQLTIQQEGRVLGTANYCAPEQAIDSHRVDSRADLYSLGCTLYFLLAGRPPFHEGSLAQRLLAHQNMEPAEIGTLRKDVPKSLRVLLRRMMAKSPGDRILTASQVAEELERIATQLDQKKPSVTLDQSRPAITRAAAPSARSVENDALAELRDAIGKVDSVERAVAMLQSDLGTSAKGGRLIGRLKPGELNARRAKSRHQQARRMVSTLGLVLAVLLSTLSTWTSPGASGRLKPIASASSRPAARPATPSASRPPGSREARPQAIVADAGEGPRSG